MYLRSFMKVCRQVGFNKQTGFHYWKMFFIILFRNTKAIEAAVNLAAMYIHFQKQKSYIVSSIGEMIKNSKENNAVSDFED